MNKIRNVVLASAVTALLFGAGAVAAQTSTQTTHQNKTTAQSPSKSPATSQTGTTAHALTTTRQTQAKQSSPGSAISSGVDNFFVISSYNKAHGFLVVLLPTEITADLVVTDKTPIFDEKGKPIKLSDLQAGATIFANVTTKPDGSLVATRIREGVMTVAEMHKRYLPGYPITTSSQTPAGTAQGTAKGTAIGKS
jgi:hypothetical protein